MSGPRRDRLIDLDTGAWYEWVDDPNGCDDPGYALVDDHDFSCVSPATSSGTSTSPCVPPCGRGERCASGDAGRRSPHTRALLPGGGPLDDLVATLAASVGRALRVFSSSSSGVFPVE